MNRQTCDKCGSEIHNESIDLTISTTTYDEEGDCMETMKPVDNVDQDYVVICTICAPSVKVLWNALLDQIAS